MARMRPPSLVGRACRRSSALSKALREDEAENAQWPGDPALVSSQSADGNLATISRALACTKVSNARLQMRVTTGTVLHRRPHVPLPVCG